MLVGFTKSYIMYYKPMGDLLTSALNRMCMLIIRIELIYKYYTMYKRPIQELRAEEAGGLIIHTI